MEVHAQRSRVLTAGAGLADAPTEVPLTVFDRFAPNLHVPIMFAYHPPMPENDDIVAALSAALSHFPTLAGSLGYSRELGRPCIHVGGPGGGVLLVEATVPTPLSDHLPLQPSTRLDVLRPPPGAERDHVFMVQITRFACGGAVFVSAHHHHVADGRSMCTFFSLWARALWGDTLDRLPIYDRSWLRPRSPPRCEFDHWGTEFVAPRTAGVSLNGVGGARAAAGGGGGITNVVLHYPEDYIAKLRDEVGNKYSSFETLLGHLWRKMAVARGLRGGDRTMLRVSVNGRGRMDPPAPDEFFGNLVVNAYPKTDARRLLAGGLAGAAATVHDAVRRVDGRYLQSFVDFGELHGDEDLVPVYDVDGVVPVYDAAEGGAAAAAPTVVLEVDNWLSFRIDEIGGPMLCGFLLPWLPFEGSVVFMPAIGDAGGVHVFVTLLEEHAVVLRQISHSMDDEHFLRSSL